MWIGPPLRGLAFAGCGKPRFAFAALMARLPLHRGLRMTAANAAWPEIFCTKTPGMAYKPRHAARKNLSATEPR